MRIPVAVGVCLCALAGSVLVNGQMLYHAKIALEDGTPLPTTPQIEVGRSEYLAPACLIQNVFGNGTVVYRPNWRGRPYDPKTDDECPITIRLQGYRTTTVVMRDKSTIVLKRSGGDHEGSTVSATTLKAPEDARKAYAKGILALNEQKLGPAQKNLLRAVEIYPEYAQAWSDLGEVYVRESRPQDARDAWNKALTADPKYAKVYVQLARLEASEAHWKEAFDVSGRGMELKAVDLPGLYFYHAVAAFNLKDYPVAEKSALQTVQLDADHEIPRAEQLLGLCLAAKGDNRGALQHMKKYLELSPKAEDAPQVKKTVAMLEEAIVRSQQSSENRPEGVEHR